MKSLFPNNSLRFNLICLSLVPPITFSAIAEEEIVATYQGGKITQEEVDSWVKAIGERATSRIPIYQIHSYAIAKYLGEHATSKASDPTIEIQIERFRAAAVRSHYTQELYEKHRPDPKQIEKDYDELKDQFGKPYRARLRNVFKTKEDKTEEEISALRNHMKEVRARLEEGADFQKVAFEESDSSNRFDGGIVGTVGHDNIRKDIADKVFQLKEGEISPVIETEDGFHIFLCEELFESIVVSEEEKHRRIEKYLHKQTYNTIWEEQRKRWIEGSKLHLEALQKGQGDEIALELISGDTFTVTQVRTLLKTGLIPLDPTRTPVSAELVLKRLSGFIVDSIATQKYLAEHEMPEDVVETMKWKELQIISDHELGLRIANSAMPATPTEADLRAVYEKSKDSLLTDKRYVIETFAMRIEQEMLREDAMAVEEYRQTLADNPSLPFTDASKSLPANILERAAILPPQSKNKTEMFAMGHLLNKVVPTLKPGETSPVFRIRTGKSTLWIVRLIDVQEPQQITFEEAKPGLITFLTKQRKLEYRQKIETEILEEMDFHHIKSN